MLGPELAAEGWIAIGDWITWLHVPSHRSVSVEDYLWEQCTGVPAVPDAPSDPKTEGWVVSCRVHDELGNPIQGTCFWMASWADALRQARSLRASILVEHVPPAHGEQLTFDDLVTGGLR